MPSSARLRVVAAVGIATAILSVGLAAGTSAIAATAAPDISPATHTTLTASASSVTYGAESEKFTATVTTNDNLVATGTVVVTFDSTTTLCTITLGGGTGSCTYSGATGIGVGSSQPIWGTYQGDANHSSSTGVVDLTVNAATTTTTLPALTGTTYGAAVKFSATVSPEYSGTPTGTVTIAEAGQTLCSYDIPTATSCTMPTTVLLVPTTYQVTATYSGDGNFSSSTSTAQQLAVGKSNSVTTLAMPVSSVAYGNEERASFGVSVTPAAGGTPTGTVLVETGNDVLCTFSATTALCDMPTETKLNASATPYPILALYEGDGNFNGSVIQTEPDLTVTSDPTSTSLTLSSTSVADGSENTVEFEASVTPTYSEPMTGTVTISTGSQELCSYNISSATYCTMPAGEASLLSPTKYPVTASYGGDGSDQNFATSTSTPQQLTVGTADTTTSLSQTQYMGTYGDEQAITFGASVISQVAGTPTGTVTISANGSPLCTYNISTASSCTLQPTQSEELAPTMYAVQATYNGDGTFSASSSSLEQLAIVQAASGTFIALSQSTGTYGDEGAVKFEASVISTAAGTPSGSVSFSENGQALCSYDIPKQTSCAISATDLPAGTYQVSADYSGDSYFNGSGSGPEQLTIRKASSTTALTLSATKATYGGEQGVQFKATAASAAGAPTGTVTIESGATLCSFSYPKTDSCTMAATKLPAGTYQVTASYGGNTDFAASGSAPVQLTIAKASSTTALTLSAAKVTYGGEQGVTFKAALTSAAAGLAGTVTITESGVALCSFSYPKTVSCTMAATKLPAGTYEVTAKYGGNTDFAASVSAAQKLTIAKASSTTALTLSKTTVTYGSEQAERLTVTVHSPVAGVGGTVTITATATGHAAVLLCKLTLKAGAASCTLKATTLKTGKYSITAAFLGALDFAPSTGPVKALTVQK